MKKNVHRWNMKETQVWEPSMATARQAVYEPISRLQWEKALCHTRPIFCWFIEFLAHPHTSPTPYHIPFQFSPFFYFPCQNALVWKLPDCSHGLCTHMLDSRLDLSRTSNTGNFWYHKYWVSQELVKQTPTKCICTESYGLGEFICAVILEVGGDSGTLKRF